MLGCAWGVPGRAWGVPWVCLGRALEIVRNAKTIFGTREEFLTCYATAMFFSQVESCIIPIESPSTSDEAMYFMLNSFNGSEYEAEYMSAQEGARVVKFRSVVL